MELDEIVKLVKRKIDELEGFPIEASGRHLHLSREDANLLFGENYIFNIQKELSQPGQFAYKERVRLIGPKGILENVIILGPCRSETQIELSITDCRILGVDAVLKNSSEIPNTPGIVISNGQNIISVKSGVIVARRHIHMSEKDAQYYGVKDKQMVEVKVLSERPLIFQDVLVRVNNSFVLSMHIDYDEANACMLTKNSKGIIVK